MFTGSVRMEKSLKRGSIIQESGPQARKMTKAMKYHLHIEMPGLPLT
ncbi:hypothetical protein ES703_02274 [subsurface metagenome]